MQEKEWQHHGTRVTLRASGGVAWMVVKGVLSRDVLMTLRPALEAAAEQDAVQAFVLRLESAAFALTGDSIDAIYSSIPPGSALAQPGAWVVRPEMVKLARGIAWRIARTGIVRAVFSDFSEAARWATAKVGRQPALHC